ncbi:hypothetical protein [Hydrogenophaga aquatica]
MKPLSKLHTEAIEKAQTEQAKVKAAALAMIETPMDLIKAVLLKHEEAVIEVMRELHQQQQADTALLRQALDTLAYWLEHGETPGAHDMIQRTHDALRARLHGDNLSPTAAPPAE